MTTEQKNSYLEAHMEVQQHMHHVSMQLNKQAQQNHSTSHNQSLVSNQGISGLNQSSSSTNVSNPYLGANPIKVSSSFDCYLFNQLNYNFFLLVFRHHK